MQVKANKSGAVSYRLPIGDELIEMNPLIGQPIQVEFDQQINCIHCDKKTKKSFNQGYCYRCLMTLAQCDTCIIKPENCHYHQGTCREPEWGETHCMTDHFVYLANTGTVKVGITRHVTDGISSRWIDQGASQALAIMRTKNRLLSGVVETAFKQYIADKTNWRTMLKGPPEQIDLVALREELFNQVEPELEAIASSHGLQAYSLIDVAPVNIDYPVEQYPEKIKSINLDKELGFSGTLQGIKGQYWIMDQNRVINMRKYAGYQLSISH